MTGGAGEHLDDATLLHRVREGDSLAFAALFDRHAPALAANVRRLLPPAIRRKLSVSDVIQETRIAAFLGIDGFENRGDGALRAWLLRIAEFKARHAFERFGATGKRAVSREVTRGGRAATEAFPSRVPSPSEAAIGLELAEAVHRALRRLPPDYREVLRLTRIDGLTLAKASQHMSRSREATKKLYGRAMSRFAAVYDAMTKQGHA